MLALPVTVLELLGERVTLMLGEFERVEHGVGVLEGQWLCVAERQSVGEEERVEEGERLWEVHAVELPLRVLETVPQGVGEVDTDFVTVAVLQPLLLGVAVKEGE